MHLDATNDGILFGDGSEKCRRAGHQNGTCGPRHFELMLAWGTSSVSYTCFRTRTLLARSREGVGARGVEEDGV